LDGGSTASSFREKNAPPDAGESQISIDSSLTGAFVAPSSIVVAGRIECDGDGRRRRRRRVEDEVDAPPSFPSSPSSSGGRRMGPRSAEVAAVAVLR
jgi:hypothetical protein